MILNPRLSPPELTTPPKQGYIKSRFDIEIKELKLFYGGIKYKTDCTRIGQKKTFVNGLLILSEQNVKLRFDGSLYQNTWVSLTLSTLTEIYLEFEKRRLFIE